MSYVLDFTGIPAYAPDIAKGVAMTIQLIAVGGGLGMAVAIGAAWVRTHGPKGLRPLVIGYVELIRNTPFLIQLFFIFFGLPSLGVHLPEAFAAQLAMVINLGAYGAEIIRAGIEATPPGQYAAAASLGLSRVQVFRHVVLIPALQRIWPALSSQLVIVMLGSSVVSQIAVEDLAHAASLIQSRTFRAFEAYAVSTTLYFLLALALRQLLRSLGLWLFPAESTR